MPIFGCRLALAALTQRPSARQRTRFASLSTGAFVTTAWPLAIAIQAFSSRRIASLVTRHQTLRLSLQLISIPHMLLSPSFRAVILTLLPAISQVLAGQVPVYNNVIGGAPDASARAQNTKANILAATGNGPTVQTTPGKLRVKAENSGICETTPGVYQASGYGDLTATQSLW